MATAAQPQLQNCSSGALHEWDRLGGHCRHCGACDEYLGKHNHSNSGYENGASFRGEPFVAAPAEVRQGAGLYDLAAYWSLRQEDRAWTNEREFVQMTYGVRKDGTWGPIERLVTLAPNSIFPSARR
jgi:hypothetical protein